jgi:MFS family permease
MCIGAAQNFPQLMALRALQGFFECTISPGFMLIIGTWYRTDEHTSRSLFFQSADAGWGIIGSLAMYPSPFPFRPSPPACL